MPCGGGIYGGQTHSQSIEALFLVRWVLDEASPHPEGRCWLGKPPEAGLWKRFR